ncbi:hypothetical protein BZA77DRAFT_389287 [Pyronema omphalodes]|nr:hypothetical protein BZA77DRAFT_389287 [Pyronema omphalodes]
MKFHTLTLLSLFTTLTLSSPVPQSISGPDHCMTTLEIYHTLPRSFTLLSNGTELTLSASNTPTPSSSGRSQIFSLNNGLLTYPGNIAYIAAAPLDALASVRRVVFGAEDEQQGRDERFEARPRCGEGLRVLEVLPGGRMQGGRFCLMSDESGEKEVWVKQRGADVPECVDVVITVKRDEHGDGSN